MHTVALGVFCNFNVRWTQYILEKWLRIKKKPQQNKTSFIFFRRKEKSARKYVLLRWGFRSRRCMHRNSIILHSKMQMRLRSRYQLYICVCVCARHTRPVGISIPSITLQNNSFYTESFNVHCMHKISDNKNCVHALRLLLPKYYCYFYFFFVVVTRLRRGRRSVEDEKCCAWKAKRHFNDFAYFRHERLRSYHLNGFLLLCYGPDPILHDFILWAFSTGKKK